MDLVGIATEVPTPTAKPGAVTDITLLIPTPAVVPRPTTSDGSK